MTTNSTTQMGPFKVAASTIAEAVIDHFHDRQLALDGFTYVFRLKYYDSWLPKSHSLYYQIVQVEPFLEPMPDGSLTIKIRRLDSGWYVVEWSCAGLLDPIATEIAGQLEGLIRNKNDWWLVDVEEGKTARPVAEDHRSAEDEPSADQASPLDGMQAVAGILQPSQPSDSSARTRLLPKGKGGAPQDKSALWLIENNPDLDYKRNPLLLDEWLEKREELDGKYDPPDDPLDTMRSILKRERRRRKGQNSPD
jgi:hypothetical protein